MRRKARAVGWGLIILGAVAIPLIVIIGALVWHTDADLSRWTDWATICALAFAVPGIVVIASERITGPGREDGRGRLTTKNKVPVAGRKAHPRETGDSVGDGSEYLGHLLTEEIDPLAFEVNPPVEPDASLSRKLSPLTPYFQREHDKKLARITQAALEGRSGIAVLVGDSSTGKTRACWETLKIIRDASSSDSPWRLWHPLVPSRPKALLQGLPYVTPRTVIWLNDAQFYLDASDGEEVAAALRELLRDLKRRPVLVLATLWPGYWSELMTRPFGPTSLDSHAQARELLTGHDISVPLVFDETQLRDLAKADDPRLAQAASYASDGEVIQYLAGAPELLSRYTNASPGPKSLILAAMDARRLGVRDAVSLVFLEVAAPAYLTDRELNSLGENWLLSSLEEVGEPGKGALAPLASARRPRHSSFPVEKKYRLADYLDQYARRTRRKIIPPLGFWAACETFSDRIELRELGNAAEARGVLRIAARLHRRAAALGDAKAAARLAKRLHQSDPEAFNATRQFLEHVSVDEVEAVTELVHELEAAGAVEWANELLMSAIARVSLEDSRDLALLLRVARGANDDEGVQARVGSLLARDPATHVSLDSLASVTELAEHLRLVQGTEQARLLMSRAAAEADLDDANAVSKAVKIMVQLGIVESLHVLFARDPASYVPLNDLLDLALLLTSLHEAGAESQAAVLAERTSAVPVDRDNLDDLQAAVEELWESGAREQATALAYRASICGCPDDPGASVLVARMLDTVEAEEFVSALIDRCPVYHADLTDPSGVAELLSALWLAGDERNLAELLETDPATSIECKDPAGVASLLSILMELGAEQLELDLEHLGLGPEQQVETLLARDPATRVALDLPDSVAALLEAMHKAGAAEQIKILARRAAEECENFASAPRSLLRAMRNVGAEAEADTLVNRLPAEGYFESFLAEKDNKFVYQFGREPESGNPAKRWGWEDLDLSGGDSPMPEEAVSWAKGALRLSLWPRRECA